MSISGVSAAGIYASSQQVQALGQQKHGRSQAASISDVDAQSSSVASAPSTSGKVGIKVNLTV